MDISQRHGRSGRLVRPAGLLVVVALVLTGCAALGHHDGDSDAAGDTAHAGDPVGAVYARESRRDRLNDGYSALYTELTGLSKVNDIFYVKIESDDVQAVTDDVTDYSGHLADRLKALTGQFPALDIHRTTTPPIIEAMHTAQRDGTLKRFAPVVGETGTVFERGLLIRLLGAVDQQRYLTQVLGERESDPALAKIMQQASAHYADLFDQINALLKKRFYRASSARHAREATRYARGRVHLPATGSHAGQAGRQSWREIPIPAARACSIRSRASPSICRAAPWARWPDASAG